MESRPRSKEHTQFKFASEYQLQWVETNDLWNFENNLLLLKRWERGMTANNIKFTHSPFWLQVWGLPFDMLTKKTGKDIGNSLGSFLAADPRSWSSNQAKFMRIRVNIPLNKPLRRFETVTNPEGDAYRIFFRYERLPVFCFKCGIMGHDERHCQSQEIQPNEQRQYGEWLQAQSGVKGRGVKEGQPPATPFGYQTSRTM